MILQPVLGRVFKTMHAHQALLGIRMGDVKSSVTLAPMTTAELGPRLTQALVASLTSAGWFPWGNDLLREGGDGNVEASLPSFCMFQDFHKGVQIN